MTLSGEPEKGVKLLLLQSIIIFLSSLCSASPVKSPSLKIESGKVYLCNLIKCFHNAKTRAAEADGGSAVPLVWPCGVGGRPRGGMRVLQAEIRLGTRGHVLTTQLPSRRSTGSVCQSVLTPPTQPSEEFKYV